MRTMHNFLYGVATAFAHMTFVFVLSATCVAYAEPAKSTEYQGGYITITFDDARRDQHLNAFPILKEFGLRGTTFLQTGDMTDEPVNEPWAHQTWSEAKQWLDAGWEIAAHTLMHPRLTTVSDWQLKAELSYPAMQIFRRLGVVPTSFAAPYGAFDHRVRAAVEQVYDAHVWWNVGDTERMGFNSLASVDPYNIGRFDTTIKVTVEKYCSWVDIAVKEKLWLVPVFHSISDSPAIEKGDWQIATETFRNMMVCTHDAISRGELKAAPIAEVLEIIPEKTGSSMVIAVE